MAGHLGCASTYAYAFVLFALGCASSLTRFAPANARNCKKLASRKLLVSLAERLETTPQICWARCTILVNLEISKTTFDTKLENFLNTILCEQPVSIYVGARFCARVRNVEYQIRRGID